MIMTNGLGATVGTISAMAIVNHFVNPADSPEMQLEGWRTCWYIFAAYAAVVAVLFAIFFRDDRKQSFDEREIKSDEAATIGAPAGQTEI